MIGQKIGQTIRRCSKTPVFLNKCRHFVTASALILGLSGCVSARQVELEFQVRQLEKALAYAQEDNVALLKVVDQYERGLKFQAELIYKLDRNCGT